MEKLISLIDRMVWKKNWISAATGVVYQYTKPKESLMKAEEAKQITVSAVAELGLLAAEKAESELPAVIAAIQEAAKDCNYRVSMPALVQPWFYDQMVYRLTELGYEVIDHIISWK